MMYMCSTKVFIDITMSECINMTLGTWSSSVSPDSTGMDLQTIFLIRMTQTVIIRDNSITGIQAVFWFYCYHA